MAEYASDRVSRRRAMPDRIAFGLTVATLLGGVWFGWSELYSAVDGPTRQPVPAHRKPAASTGSGLDRSALRRASRFSAPAEMALSLANREADRCSRHQGSGWPSSSELKAAAMSAITPSAIHGLLASASRIS